MQLLESEVAPECILPAQYYDRPFGGARLLPEKRLQLAVLGDAVLTFHGSLEDERARARYLFAEVDAWFASDDVGGPFTFITICDSLKFDPGYIRQGLRQRPSYWESTAEQERSVGRDGNATRPQAVLPRLRRVA